MNSETQIKAAPTKQSFIIQIYEIQTPYEAEKMIGLGVDHIGSVVLSREEWKVPSIRETVKLVSETDSRSSLIPLFSDPDTIFRALDYYKPHILHCCEGLGDRNGIFKNCKNLIALQENVRKRFPGVKIMRSVPIAEPGMGEMIPSLEAARLFEAVSDYFLTDTYLINADQPAGGGFVGITGRICDRDIARKLVETSRIPVILAGGITPENVSDSIEYVRPAGVDSCTGTNAVDDKGNPVRFKKDIHKVKQMVEAARK
ncbi:MAG: hypothetical protein BWK80_43725 [Desulfobacteraceae bacterium IS3]|nr:MAG: hypothetical protein BWK80_43725 [Desulfobacteraceae bacterium IS3]